MFTLMPALSVAIAVSLFLIAALHLYWGLGGKWAAHATLPATDGGKPLFRPGLLACTVVAVGLVLMAWLLLTHVGLLSPVVTLRTSAIILTGVAVIFALRCVGDFRYFGIFRSIRHTDFAAMDRKLYTPLCATYATAFAVAAWLR